MDPLEFLARLVTHIPDPGQVMQRYYGWYASRTRGGGGRDGNLQGPRGPLPSWSPADWSLRAARFRWADRSLRPHFLAPPRGNRTLGGGMAAPAVLYVNGTKSGELDGLKFIMAADVAEVRFLDAGKAQDEYGVDHRGGRSGKARARCQAQTLVPERILVLRSDVTMT